MKWFYKVACELLLGISILPTTKAQIFLHPFPLTTFLQQNFDSSIVYFQTGTWYNQPSYLILSKKNNSVWAFTYTNPYPVDLSQTPDFLKKFFVDKSTLFQFTIPDTNQYFLPRIINDSVLENGWNNIIYYEPWKLKGDSITPLCTDKNKNCWAEDDLDDNYFLITKSALKILSFYDPVNIEKCCPGNINRQKEIDINNLIKKILY